ncbi:MAG: hypothetical protein ACOYUZ_00545 [Patescibacteria group bacterium]
MRYLIVFAVLLSFGFFSASPANAILPPNGIDASKIIFDPDVAPRPILPVNENAPDAGTDATLIFQPIPIPEIIIPPDFLKGPQISDIKMASDGERLLVEWKTSGGATSKIEYGLSATYTKMLEDKELTVEHAMAIPVLAPEIHVRITSADQKKNTSQTQDIIVAIPNVAPPAPEPSFATTSEPVMENLPEEISDKTVSADTEQPPDQEQAKPQTIDDAPDVTITNMILGGIALVLAGILIGVLIKTRKPSEE